MRRIERQNMKYEGPKSLRPYVTDTLRLLRRQGVQPPKALISIGMEHKGISPAKLGFASRKEYHAAIDGHIRKLERLKEEQGKLVGAKTEK
jgi:hypothetical protein